MQPFEEIFALSASRHGGAKELEKKIGKPLSRKKIRAISDDRWLSGMTMSIFQAGFVWRVVENKWHDFETVFQSFDLVHCAYLSDEDIESLTNDKRVIRHLKKLQAIRHNATYLLEKAETFGSVGDFIIEYPPDEYIELLLELKTNAARLGGMSAQYFLRKIGVDSFILSRDVVKALVRAKLVAKTPTSKRDLANVQLAFNHWREESGRSLTEISRVLAMSVD